MKKLLLATTLAAVTMGCMEEQPHQDDPASPRPDRVEVTDPVAAALVGEIKKDMAGRTGASIGGIEVIEFEEVLWPDTSLGCPQPGHVYAQVITPGYRIVLRADGQAYRYHTDKGKNFVLCDSASG